MRILFVSHYFPPVHTAGTETYAYNLAMRMKGRHEIRIFHTEKRIALPEYSVHKEQYEGMEKRVLISNRCYSGFRETFINPRAEQAFEKVLDEFKPDVVHVHHLMFTSFRLPVIARKRGIPVVMTLHDFFLICARGGRLMLGDENLCPGPSQERCAACLSTYKYRQSDWEARTISMLAKIRSGTGIDLNPFVYWLRDRVFKRDLSAGTIKPIQGDPAGTFPPLLKERREALEDLAAAVSLFMTPSNTVGDAVKAHGIPAEKVKHWRYGIDQSPFRRGEKKPHDVPVFGYFGTYMPHKGVHTLVHAAASLSPTKGRLVVRGSAAYNPGYLEDLKKVAGPATVFKPGFGRHEIAEAFEEIDVLVLPSLWFENSPVVIQEAFAAQCPVITSDLGGMRELVRDGVDGRLFPPGDVSALTTILREVTTQPGLIDEWRRGITPPRTIEDDAQALEALYTELIASS